MSFLEYDESSDGSQDSDDGYDFDDIADLNDAAYLTDLFHSITHDGTSTNNPSFNIRPAFGGLTRSTIVSSSIFGDSIRSYIETSTLHQPTMNATPYYLSIDPILNESNSNSFASEKLFVGNISYTATSSELKQFLIDLRYNVIRIDLPNSRRTTGHAGYAFVQLDSVDSVENALYQFARTPQKFTFKHRRLTLDRYKPRQKTKTVINEDSMESNSFPIINIHYGTFIMDTVMNKITGTHMADNYGLIAHGLINNEHQIHFRLRIDTKQREISIVGTYESLDMYGSTTSLAFIWPFGVLKGDKISPVLINHSQVGLLVELKRAPIILCTTSHNLTDSTSETRLPGTPLIGRANAWLFQLASSKIVDNYMNLFRMLRHYNLTPQRFVAHHIVRLIHPLKSARENLRNVQVLSNDQWVKDNRERVNHFLNNRWPQYPFETKFELMKLLSKHIITINDLIVDGQFDCILSKCSINTFITCSSKIIEFAPRWLHETCDNEDEDWGEEEQQELTEDEGTSLESTSPVIIQSATGMSIDISSTAYIFPSNNINRLIPSTDRQHLGCLSRFLRLAIRQLQKKHELRQFTNNGLLVTKHELHSSNNNSFLIRKIYITPSTILYEGPYTEEKSLVTRHYTDVQDGFMRISFRDEDYRKLQSVGPNMRKLYNRIKAILINGIAICDRQYDFVAFSSSQLREHCCWMFSSMDNATTNSIRQWMGDFRNIHPVAKMAARLGQSFSTTKKGLELQSRQYREISDVKSGTTCFTDGIGIIAPWLVKELCKELHIDDDFYQPCAFQIRFGGWKGMICLDAASRITDPRVGLYLRPSMNKFDSKNQSIGIVRVSSMPSAGFLNQQIILLLSCLGIADKVFFDMQEDMLTRLSSMTVDYEQAREFLQQFGGSSGNGYHKFLLEYLKRFGKQIDPFVRQILMAFQGYHVKQLRTKAHIFVPNTWCLFGVVDETRTLQYGEVFIQIEQKNASGDVVSKIITGSVIVTRNPCFHPGDIRRLNAVDIPALYQLKNVIVFPIHGIRSHPAEMSGGDLDGDTFWISCEEKLLFTKKEQPFDYHTQAIEDAHQLQISTNTVYTINDVCNFFVEYIEADNLGVIAHSHLAFADQSPQRAKDSRCEKLARMHSTAVDFAKSGVSAPRLTPDLRPVKYPHFMEKKHKPEYHSEMILGQLYDRVKQFEIDLNRDQRENIEQISTFSWHTLIVDGSNSYMPAAKITKNEYDFELKRLMRQYGIQSEAQLVSGYILKFTSRQYAKQAKMYDLRNEITYAVKVIQEKYLRIFYDEIYHQALDKQELTDETPWSEASKTLTWHNQLNWFSFRMKDEITLNSEIVKKASAWFRVTYKRLENQTKKKHNRKRKNHPQDRGKSQQLLSFAWIVYPVLMKIFDDKIETE